MKKYIYGIMAMILGAVTFIACEEDIDEVAQWNKLSDYSVRIEKLESACEVINSNVVSLNALAEAQKDNIGITDVKDVEEGCVIFFANGKYVVLRNGKDGADGKDGKDGTNGVDGKDGYVPAIAIKKDTDGIYYWTCDGAFMLDETGNKVPAQGKDGENGTNGTNGLVAQFMISATGELQYRYNDTDAWTSLGNVKGADGINGINGTNGTNGVDGKTPTFKIVEGNLLVSYDGVNWKDLGNVKGADGANGTNGSNGADGINGTNGKDGITPEFMIQDGKWFVSYNNKYSWVELGQATGDKGDKGENGATVNGKDGITPKLKIVDGYWYISYDGGKTYETEPLGKATGDKGDKGDKGDAGVDGKTPTFKIESGVLFVSYDATTWTSLGKISGENGTDGKTPTMKIESGDWYVSYDEGETWTKLGQATGDKGDKGDNGITPTFKVESGNLYVSYNEGTSWTNLGNVKGADGTAGTAGVTPKLKITDGYWYISYDNEKTWTKLDKATGANGANGKTPSFKVEGGVLFVSYDATTWTSLGKISGENGTDGKTPTMKIESGDWYVSYDEGETWTKLGQATGDKGDNGDNGITPTFKVESGNLYVSYNEGTSWTNLGKVKGADGTAGSAGVTPKFKITDGYWYVSYDNGTTWTKLDKATGANGVDGKTPELSINSEGHLISTVNGVATDLGNVTGATPVIKVEDGKWKVSTDGGTNWTEIEGSSTVGGGTVGYTSLGAPVSGYVDGYAYVDLGLTSGKKWATANVGAINEADYGLYFWWGDVIGYDKNTEHDSSGANADTYNKSSSQLQSAGIIGTDKNLVAERDAAKQQWSDNWKMPTKADFDELLSECRWTWVSYGTANGYKVESKKAGNNNWIFLPAAGYRNGTSSNGVGSYGSYYWSSTMYEGNSSSAYNLDFNYSSNSTSNSRTRGHTIRPVVKETIVSTTYEVSFYNSDGTLIETKNVEEGQDAVAPVAPTLSGYEFTGWDKTFTNVHSSLIVTATYKKLDVPSKSGNGTLNGYEYVDLGLPSGLKWATMNVGASINYDNGAYFAWGEVTSAPSNNFSTANCNAYGKTKAQLVELGIIQSETKPYLTAEYDAATANWGEGWRMPTKAEFEELLNNCTWTWTSLGGVKGYKVVSMQTGNTNWIFLPAAGYRGVTSSSNVGSEGLYWSSTVNESYTSRAYLLYFNSSSNNTPNNYTREFGHTVRPVVK